MLEYLENTFYVYSTPKEIADTRPTRRNRNITWTSLITSSNSNNPGSKKAMGCGFRSSNGEVAVRSGIG